MKRVRRPIRPRTGIGVDVHRLADGVPMRLAGLTWPDEPRGLDGHSDGDVCAHAMCDAPKAGADSPTQTSAIAARFFMKRTHEQEGDERTS